MESAPLQVDETGQQNMAREGERKTVALGHSWNIGEGLATRVEKHPCEDFPTNGHGEGDGVVWQGKVGNRAVADAVHEKKDKAKAVEMEC